MVSENKNILAEYKILIKKDFQAKNILKYSKLILKNRS